MSRPVAFVLALVGALLVAFVASLPPGALPANADPSLFSAGRAMADVRAIAAAPHPTGSAESAQVRLHLMGRMQGLGLEVSAQPFELPAKSRERLERWGANPAGPLVGVNLIGVLPGRDRSQPAVALMAHTDTVAGSPGAGDDSAGVAAILEIVRVLRTGPRERDLVVVLTDAEELDLDGARAFFTQHLLAKRIGVVVNLEARGGGGRAVMFETAPQAGGLMALFHSAVDQPSAHSLAVSLYRLMPNSSDFTVALDHGVQGFNFAFMGKPSQYHSPTATADALSTGSLQHLGAQALDLTRALLSAPALPARGPDPVFSDLFGQGLVLYPVWGGWILVGVTAVFLVLGGLRNYRTFSILGVLSGAARALGLTLAAGAALYLANLLSGGGVGADYFDRLAALGRLEIQAGCVGAALLIAGLGLRRPDSPPAPGWLGALLLGLAGMVALQLKAPQAAPPFAWPVLVAAFSHVVWSPRRTWPTVLLAIAGGGLALAMAHLTFLGVGAERPEAMAAFVLLLALLTWPLAARSRPWQAAAAALGLIVAGVALALWVRFDPPADTAPVWRRPPELTASSSG